MTDLNEEIRRAVYERQCQAHARTQEVYKEMMDSFTFWSYLFSLPKFRRLEKEWDAARAIHHEMCKWHHELCDKLKAEREAEKDEPSHMLKYGGYPSRSKSFDDVLDSL